MNMRNVQQYHLIFIGLSLSLSSFVTNIQAAPAPIITSTQERMDRTNNAVGIGLTLSLTKRPFIAVPDQASLLPYFSYQYERFYVEGLDVGINLLQQKSFKIDLLTTPRFYEVKSSFAKSGELDGIDTTRPTYFAGLSAQLHTPAATYTFQLLHDPIESDGNEAVLQIGKSFQMNPNWSLTPSVGVSYQDSTLVDYFYGVQSNEVRSGRPRYVGNSALNYNVTLNAVWNATLHIDMLGQIKYETLAKGITDSPIVDETAIHSITIGTVYRF
jgi:outer membrane protein